MNISASVDKSWVVLKSKNRHFMKQVDIYSKLKK